MTRRNTHIAQMRAQYEYNKLQVLWLTGMTEEQLYALQFDTGLDWLERYTQDDRDLLFELMQQPIIWKWWVNEWNRRDDDEYLRALYLLPPDDRFAMYRAKHQEVFITRTPPYSLLEDAYSKAIGRMIHQKTHH